MMRSPFATLEVLNASNQLGTTAPAAAARSDDRAATTRYANADDAAYEGDGGNLATAGTCFFFQFLCVLHATIS